MNHHPMQKIETDAKGVVRFRKNAIVEYLLDAGPFDLNHLARMKFSDEDSQQFAQLIGYSVCGFCDLSYVDDATADKAIAKAAKLQK